MWILIIMMHVGPMGSGNSNAITSVGGFIKKQACIDAGEASKKMASGTVKEIRYVCAAAG